MLPLSHSGENARDADRFARRRLIAANHRDDLAAIVEQCAAGMPFAEKGRGEEDDAAFSAREPIRSRADSPGDAARVAECVDGITAPQERRIAESIERDRQLAVWRHGLARHGDDREVEREAVGVEHTSGKRGGGPPESHACAVGLGAPRYDVCGGRDVYALGVGADQQACARSIDVSGRALHHHDHALGGFLDVLGKLRGGERRQKQAQGQTRNASHPQASHSRPLSHLNTAIAAPHRYNAEPQNRLTPCRAWIHSSHVGIRLIWLSPRPMVMPCTVP